MSQARGHWSSAKVSDLKNWILGELFRAPNPNDKVDDLAQQFGGASTEHGTFHIIDMSHEMHDTQSHRYPRRVVSHAQIS